MQPVTDPLQLERDRLRALEQLHALVVDQVRIDGQVRDAARDAKAAGATWDTIGQVLGVTRQAAYQRYGRSTAEVLGLGGRS